MSGPIMVALVGFGPEIASISSPLWSITIGRARRFQPSPCRTQPTTGRTIISPLLEPR
jgi:hypothetical protein